MWNRKKLLTHQSATLMDQKISPKMILHMMQFNICLHKNLYRLAFKPDRKGTGILLVPYFNKREYVAGGFAYATV